MQPRLLHMFAMLGFSPGQVPASNLVFPRSRREGDLAEFGRLADLCWPFHDRVISGLQPKVILCLGRTVGEFVCAKVGAHHCVETFTESNKRRWQSHAFRSSSGMTVVVATHPSIADWSAVATDPTGLMVRALCAKE
jgi:uracil-DNA glycosylase family 4